MSYWKEQAVIMPLGTKVGESLNPLSSFYQLANAMIDQAFDLEQLAKQAPGDAALAAHAADMSRFAWAAHFVSLQACGVFPDGCQELDSIRDFAKQYNLIIPQAWLQNTAVEKINAYAEVQ